MKLAFLSIVFLTLTLQAKTLSTREKLADFTQLNLLIESGYGPYMYKQNVRGIDVAALIEKYRAQIVETKTNAEFYYTMARYVSEYHDGHFALSVPTDYRADLPIWTDLVGGKVLIESVDRKKLTEAEFPFVRGDEIVEINGEPVSKTLDQLQACLGSGYELSERRNAAQVLFVRSARRFPVPTGEIELSIRRGTSDIIEKAKLKWNLTGTPFDENTPAPAMSLFFNSPLQGTNYDSLSIKTQLVDLMGPERLERSYRCSPGTRIAIPEGAKMITLEPFVSYYHATPKGNIGYLRIPHYSFDNMPVVFRQYEYAISVLEKNTVGLVIDQDHNCGGSVDFLQNMVSLFMSQTFKPMQFELLASKTQYFDFKKWADEAPKNTIETKDFEKVLSLIKTTWEKGDFLTPKTSINGDEVIYPNRIVYTKPIVMLIDELSGSGGDAFPAMIGGYGRATLIGTRTMGLGGHIAQPPPLNNSSLNVYLTKSLFYRPDGVAVENNGAVPDRSYTITRDDFIYGYKNYQKFYLNVLFEKL